MLNQCNTFSNRFRTGTIFLFLILTLCLSSCDCTSVNVKTNTNTNSNSSATINLSVKGLESFQNRSQNQYVTVNFTGVAIQNGDGDGNSSFSVSQTYEITTSGNINPGTVLSRIGLRPGTWSITIKINSWIMTCTGMVTKGSSKTFTFTYNAAGCNVQ